MTTNTVVGETALHRYQNDISNLRSHHWKYWIDLYANCYYNCAYCVYRDKGQMGKVTPHAERLVVLRNECRALENPGIVYLGPQSDVYQPLERKLQLTRRALEIFLETRTPVFLVTRSTLILRDLDILAKLAEHGLIEVSITIASRTTIPILEPNTPSLEERLQIIEALRSKGIPTSVHLSPIVPGVESNKDLIELLRIIGDTGADCTYACMVGVTANFHSLIVNGLRKSDSAKADLFLEAFPNAPATGELYSAPDSMVYATMECLAKEATFSGIPFASVHIPTFDTIERSGGIFRYKLPTIGDLMRYLDRMCIYEVDRSSLLEIASMYPAVDEGFLNALRRYWEDGVLFGNTPFHPVTRNNKVEAFVRKTTLDLNISNMRVGRE